MLALVSIHFYFNFSLRIFRKERFFLLRKENVLSSSVKYNSVICPNSTPTSSLINAITQTLASATPEQLQSLQQITSDLNLLQAVTSLINSQETNSITTGHTY